MVSLNGWLITLLVLSFILVVFMYIGPHSGKEAFSQGAPYVIQRGTNAYDDFYAGIYDILYKSNERSEYEAQQIVLATQPDKEFSRFLDIGCGTGCLTATIQKLGYQVIGVDKSQAMIQAGTEKRPECTLKQGDTQDSMTFDRGAFTHILCLNGTIYELKDKIAFFRNCAHWLEPGGYLVLHLMDPKKFNPIVPVGNNYGDPVGKSYGDPVGKHSSDPVGKSRQYDSPQEFSKSRITNSVVDFIDFKYKSVYDFEQVDTTGQVVQIETFTDAMTNKVRQNEHTLYMEKERDILAMTQFCGFVAVGSFTMERYNKDAFQTVHILQKL